MISSGISHLVYCPRTAWVFFVIFFPCNRYASHFSRPPSVFSRRGNIATQFLDTTPFSSRMRTHLLNGFRCFDMFGLHPDVAVANLSLSIAFRMSTNNSGGTATSAIWKTITGRSYRLKDHAAIVGKKDKTKQSKS